ncbi:hypothetical protein FKM82_024683 [Ascaphus truei]
MLWILVFCLTIGWGHGRISLSPGSRHCSVDAGDRIACAGAGVTAAQCRDKQCCFDSRVSGTIWCFKTKGM